MTMKFIENFDFASEFQVISLFLCVKASAKETEQKRRKVNWKIYIRIIAFGLSWIV